MSSSFFPPILRNAHHLPSTPHIYPYTRLSSAMRLVILSALIAFAHASSPEVTAHDKISAISRKMMHAVPASLPAREDAAKGELSWKLKVCFVG